MSATVLDFLGNAINVESRIVYAASCGRSPVLVHADVVEIRAENYIEPGKHVYSRKACLIVRPLKRLYKSYSKKPSETIALSFPERCVVVSK